MKAVPGTLQSGGASFRTTHWRMIADCRLADSTGYRALEQLCRDYWPPLYSFARRRGYSPSDAQDLVQGFFAAFLQNKGYARTSQEKGKFRTFMLASLKHYMANAWDREHALKRGGGCQLVFLDDEMKAAETLYASAASDMMLNEDQHYEQSWATSLVNCALGRLAGEFGSGPRRRIFAELKPFLCGGSGLPSQKEIARRLEIPVNTLRSHLSRLRERYCELLREEIARTIGKNDDVDEELRHFREIMSNTGLYTAEFQSATGPQSGAESESP